MTLSSFHIIQTASEFLYSFYSIRTASGSFGKFLDYPDSLWIVWIVFMLSGQFLDYPDSFWIAPDSF